MSDSQLDPWSFRTSPRTRRRALLLLTLLAALPQLAAPQRALAGPGSGVPTPTPSLPTEDLQVDFLSVTAGRDIAYLPGSGPLYFEAEFISSAKCVEQIFGFPVPPAFSANLSLVGRKGATVEEVLLLGLVNVPPLSVRLRATGAFPSGWCSYGVYASETAKASFDLSVVPGFDAFVAKARNEGLTVHLRVDLDPANQIAEINEANNSAYDLANPLNLYPLTGTLLFGSIAVPLSKYEVDAQACGSGEARPIDVAGTWTPSMNGLWDPVDITVPPVGCLALVPNGDLFDLKWIALAPLSVPDAPGSLNGLAVKVTDNALGVAGAVPGTLEVQLPSGLTHHADDGSKRPVARGSRWMKFSTLSPAVTSDYALLKASGAAGFLHARSIPLSYELDSLALDDVSMGGGFANVVYQYDYALSSRDFRRVAGFASNDRRMSLPTPGGFNFTIQPTGLSSRLSFVAGQGNTHFPRVFSQWKAFSLRIEDSEVADGWPLMGEDYEFSQSPDCGGCDAGSTGPLFSVSASSAALGWDGASVAALPALGANASWGPSENVPNGAPMFQRSGDASKPAVMLVPGYHAQATGGAQNVPVVEYLMGAREATLSGSNVLPLAHHALSSAESRAGNHFMSGITLGPDLYRSGPHNLPVVGSLGSSLANDTQLTIGFGGSLDPDYKTLTTNPGGKYVIRRGGVTGVFNTDTVPKPRVYGYSLNLDRFAIRQVSNEIDDFSWVDGSVHVLGEADFEVAFESLEIECSGDIGKGVVVRCDGSPGGANCDETLSAWEARMKEILGLQFARVPSSGDVCVSPKAGESGGICAPLDRQLEVASVVGVGALSEWVGVTAQWSPLGAPSCATLHSGADQIFDSPSGDVPGFPVALEPDAKLESDGNGVGWFTFTGDVGVPFWQSLGATMHFKNESTDVAGQSLVYAKNCVLPPPFDYTAAGDHLENECTPSADYQWGGTGWGISFPVFYDTGRYAEGESPRFLGKQTSGDLLVMEAHAGTDFITPEQTQVSFGASADFEKLRALDDLVDLHVDLNDPKSIAKIDDFLDNVLGVDGKPVASAVSNVKDEMNLLNRVADAGLDRLVEEGVRVAVRGVFDVVPDLDEALGRVDTIPEQLTARVVDALREELGKMRTPLNADLTTELLAFYDESVEALADGVEAIKLNAPFDAALRARIEDAQKGLDGVQKRLDAVRNAGASFQDLLGDDPDEGLRGVVSDVRQKKSDLFDPATSALKDAEVALVAAFACTGGEGVVTKKLREVKDKIEGVQQALSLLNLLGPLSQVASVAGVDLSGINHAQQAIHELANDSKARIAELESRLPNCANSPAEKALKLITDLHDAVTAIGNKLDSVLALLDKDSDPNGGTVDAGYIALAKTEMNEVLLPLNDLGGRIQVLDDFLGQLAADPAGLANGNRFIAPLSGEDFSDPVEWQKWLDEQVEAALGAGKSWGSSASSFTEDLAIQIETPVDALINLIAQETSAAIAALTHLVPHPSQQSLEDELVALVMNSPVVADLQDAVYAMTSELTEDLNAVGLVAFDQLNHVIKEILQGANAAINAAFSAATSAMEDWDLAAAEMDGYALITGDELSKLHVGAEFAVGSDENAFGFNAALDVTSWSANGKETGCGIDPGSGSLLDVVISTRDLPLELGASEILITKLYLGFTLMDVAPVGLFGGVFTSGEIGFSEFAIYDPGLAVGVGAYENYLGATAGAKFESVSMEVAFLVGRTCNQEVIVSLDPQVGEFLTFPDAGFAGLFVRGSASIPIWHNGCALTVGVGADAGTWILGPAPLTVGMLVGGAIYGEGLCLVSVRGQITILGEVSGITSLAPAALIELVPDNVKLQGEAFFVGGIGFDCDPGTWTSRSRSRDDDWCGTGDVFTKASFDGDFHLQAPEFSAIH